MKEQFRNEKDYPSFAQTVKILVVFEAFNFKNQENFLPRK